MISIKAHTFDILALATLNDGRCVVVSCCHLGAESETNESHSRYLPLSLSIRPVLKRYLVLDEVNRKTRDIIQRGVNHSWKLPVSIGEHQNRVVKMKGGTTVYHIPEASNEIIILEQPEY